MISGHLHVRPRFPAERASRAARRSYRHRAGRPRASQPRRGLSRALASRRRRVPAHDAGSPGRRARLRPACRPHDAVWRRLVARRPRHPGASGRQPGPDADDEGAARERGGPRLHGRGGGHAQTARSASAGDRADVPARPGSGCDHRRHGLHQGVGNDRGPLRDDEGRGARTDGRAGRWPRDSHGLARAQIVGRVQSHPALRRRGRHARHHHGSHAAASRPSGVRGGRNLLVRGDRRRGRGGHHDRSSSGFRSPASSCSTRFRSTP